MSILTFLNLLDIWPVTTILGLPLIFLFLASFALLLSLCFFRFALSCFFWFSCFLLLLVFLFLASFALLFLVSFALLYLVSFGFLFLVSFHLVFLVSFSLFLFSSLWFLMFFDSSVILFSSGRFSDCLFCWSDIMFFYYSRMKILWTYSCGSSCIFV